MSLNSALVDQARRLVQTPQPQKVEGSTQFVEVPHPWFKCRFTYGYAWSRRTAREASGEGGEERLSHNASLMTGTKDTEGNLIVISPAERIEVNSKQLGQGIFEVTGESEPIRKKKKVIGHTVTLVQVDESEFVQIPPP
jgi:hypothetical protein